VAATTVQSRQQHSSIAGRNKQQVTINQWQVQCRQQQHDKQKSNGLIFKVAVTICCNDAWQMLFLSQLFNLIFTTG